MRNLSIGRSVLMSVWPLLGALSGCGTGGTGGGEPLPAAAITFRTLDGATFQTAPIEAMVTDQGVHVDDALLQDLGARVRLRTWPEGGVVAVSAQAATAAGERLLRISATVPLEDRWYQATFESLPANVHGSWPIGADGVRFRPGSHPRVANIQFCVLDDPNATRKMVVVFSEPMAVPSGGIVSLTIAGQPANCDQYDASEGGLFFVCPELTPKASVKVSIAAGLAGVSGVAMEPTSFDVDLGRLPAADCRQFMPPI